MYIFVFEVLTAQEMNQITCNGGGGGILKMVNFDLQINCFL